MIIPIFRKLFASMNRKTRIITVIIIVLLLLGMIFSSQIKTLFKSDNSDIVRRVGDRGQPELIVNATILQPLTLQNMFRSKGVLLPDEEVNLTFETSGKITDIYFEEGSHVQKGTLLAKVNDEPLRAELKKLEAKLPLAEARVYRQRTLLEKDAVSQETYQTVITDLEALKADIELTKARIAQTELRAPFSGIIGLRFVSEGTYASPSVVVAKLTKISPLKVEFSVNESQANEIKPGTRLVFKVDNDLNSYNASVYAVEPQLDEKTFSLKARALYPNTDGKIKPGQSATIEIELSKIEQAIVIPAIAAIAEMGRDIAYIYDNGKAKRVTITKGLRTASSVQIVDGLRAGDTLLVTGVMQLRDDMPVKIETIIPNTAD
jgi:membrane fusion protein (multidrug efflux system)